MSDATLLLATSNPGKVAELRFLLARHLDLSRLALLTPADWPHPLPDVAETGATFAENAWLKARALCAATGLPALADDSGLCVDALGGAPGVHSARWAGEEATDADRNQKLLTALAGVPSERRTARFVCVVALARPGGWGSEAEGVCEGIVPFTPRGTAGFGYDPLFLLPELGLTLAELIPSEKNRLSHRAAAVAALTPKLANIFFV